MSVLLDCFGWVFCVLVFFGFVVFGIVYWGVRIFFLFVIVKLIVKEIGNWKEEKRIIKVRVFLIYMFVSMLFCGEMFWNVDVVSIYYIFGFWNLFKYVFFIFY